MAWNEPGGGRQPNDPWRNRQDPGSQELDEFLKKLQDRFGGLMGGDGKGGALGAALVALVLVALWALAGFYRLDQAEQAVVLRLGKFHEIRSAGLNWNPPLVDKVFKVNVLKQNNASLQATMLTSDENIVDIVLNVQYQVHDPRAYFLDIGNSEQALLRATESALRHVVGGSAMDSIITEGRQIMAQDVTVRLQETLNRYNTGLLVTKVNIEDAHPPKDVKAAFDDVIKAKEDETRVQNLAQAYANSVVPEARGKGQRTAQEADAYRSEVISRAEGEAQRFNKLLEEYKKAPEVTRQRLYVDTVEEVYSSNRKVLVDVNKTNNVIYLPAPGALTSAQGPDMTVPQTSAAQGSPDTAESGPVVRPTDRIRQSLENRRWEQRQ